MEKIILGCEKALTYVNGLIESVFRFILGFFITIKQKQASAKERLITKEVLFFERLFDRQFLEDELLTVPNLFSLSRIPLGLILWAMISYKMPIWTILGVHGIAILTDRLDGVWARLEGETKLGSILDPLCDKVYVGACIIAYYPMISAYIFWPLFGLELFLAFIPFVVIARIKRGRLGSETDFRANIFGKVKLFVEFIALTLFTFGSTLAANSFLLLALVFAVLSIIGRLVKETRNKATPPSN